MRRSPIALFSVYALIACTDMTQGVATCPSETVSDLKLQQAADFITLDIPDQVSVAERLVDCLGHPDPSVRDDLAYRGLAEMLRNNQFSPDAVRGLRDRLLTKLDAPDPDGFLHPFAALVLSEVARTDRIAPYMTPEERSTLVMAASDYLLSERDYRGYDDADGWRHGVAHGADWLMQLSLNPELSLDDKLVLIDAVIRTVPASDGHAFVYGEPERLARPHLYLAMGSPDAARNVAAGIARLADPAPYESWGAAFATEDGLARIHNVSSFLSAIYVAVARSENPAAKPILEATITARGALP